MTDDTSLLAALRVIQAHGAIGEADLVAAVAHADRFVDLIPGDAESLVDLGSGGGLPALVIAWRRPDVTVTMIERRVTRVDMLRRAVSSLAIGEHAMVVAADVDELARTAPRSFRVVTARAFAEPAVVAAAVDALLAPGGVALISEPPRDRTARWAACLHRHPRLADLGVHAGIRQLVAATDG